MPALETRLRILAEDDTAKAFASVKARIHGLAQEAASVRSAVGGTVGQVGTASAARKAFGNTASSISMMTGAAAAAAGMAVAYGGAIAAKEAAKAVGARQHELVRMSVSGMSGKEIAEAGREAAKLTAGTPVLGQTEALHMLRNMRSIVGTYSEAVEIAQPLSKLYTLAKLARPGQDVSEDFDHLIKGLELKGATQDPKRFAADIEMIAKAINVFGDTLRPAEFYEMVKYARQAGPGLSDKFMLSVGAEMAQAMGGTSFGTALAGFNRMIVAGVGKKQAFQELARLGLVDKGALSAMPNTGEGHALKQGRTVKGWREASEDPYQWTKDYLIPALKEVGITDRADVLREVATIFPQVAGSLVADFITQQSRIEKNLGNIAGAEGTSAAEKAMREDPILAFEALKNSATSLVASFGEAIGAGRGFAGWATDAAHTMAEISRLLQLGNSPEGRKEGDANIAHTNSRINKFLFGVDSPGTAFDALTDRKGLEAVRDRNFVQKVKALMDEDADASSRAGGSGADAQIARMHKFRVESDIRTTTGEWRADVAGRGQRDYDTAMAEARAARAAGHDGPFGPTGAAGVGVGVYQAAAQREAEVRVFGELSGEVKGEATVNVNVNVNAGDGLKADLASAHQAAEASMRLSGQVNGRMNGDAGPRPSSRVIPRGGH